MKGVKLTEYEYLKIKAGSKTTLSSTTISRVNRSKNYKDYLKIVKHDRGPQWRTKQVDTRNWWQKILNV
jgi:hypothetical protein